LPCPVTIAVKFGFMLIFSLILFRTLWKNCFVTAAFVLLSHSCCHFWFAYSSMSLYSVLFGVLL
jgi:hypothetical protein